MDYKRFHSEVIFSQNKMRNWLDSPSHPQARQLSQAFQQLEDNVQVKKAPGSLRKDLERIESRLYNVDKSVMSSDHVDELEQWVRGCLQKVR